VFIPGKTSTDADFDRLEIAISKLTESHGKLREENVVLRNEIEEGARRMRALDSDLLDANQRRQDAYKRIDELISHLDQLDAQLAETGE
jgi:translation initiation factor 2B subunit (eIF-2B alpha/beta/delta family)